MSKLILCSHHNHHSNRKHLKTRFPTFPNVVVFFVINITNAFNNAVPVIVFLYNRTLTGGPQAQRFVQLVFKVLSFSLRFSTQDHV